MTLTTAVVLFALSQSKPQPPKREISFEPDEISGERKRPDLEQIDVRPPTKFSNLIKIRTDFADKIVKSVDDM
jgi:hypothetical protein